MIATELIDSKKYPPKNIIRDILNIIPYNNRYTKSYLYLAKLIYDNYHVKEVKSRRINIDILFYKEYGINSDKNGYFGEINSENLNIHADDTIYRAIMYNDLEKFIFFTEREEFDKDQKLMSDLYPYEIKRYLSSYKGYSLLELCCYHGAVDCFKLLRTKFNSEITETCLKFSFLRGNPEIMSECLKYKKPDYQCMEYAIISHNIDFVTFLINEYKIEIDLGYSGIYNNLESFLVYFDQTNDINKCFVYSTLFDFPSLSEYFFSHGAEINTKFKYGETALHAAIYRNNKEMSDFLISHGANINEKDRDEQTAIHYSATNNNKEIAELLLSHGANINEKDKNGTTALHYAAKNNRKEIVELLISHGANVNEKEKNGRTALHYAAKNNRKEIVELLILQGADINEKDNLGKTALHYSATNNNKEIAELLLSHGANINEKDGGEQTALHYAVYFNSKEISVLLISRGANINEKDNLGKTALHFAAEYNCKETAELLISGGANINEKDNDEQTALHIAVSKDYKEISELLLSHGANINEKDIPG
ncbi:ankyrin repeat protein, putative [Trichomonas vaginalis G3]|uniref:Ankyrin repeat protein, putative n=1 Tax=Trichomonas vaginalis (strain ATCC PRA-98 / G3) TaxID=412133 RepID=A2DQ01_TRIV3|nr:ankyrin repeat and SOCS box-containing protein 4 family [Trichomonas vaginalis G3]EAY17597.1 ankyrin repeat protein, putative [Trichomonas vaginalis G3]KAI5520641.1 ankyrin repeat and SOCS box-containing protein 4 family [Trichomonas vaginalis G3]|eukprot:XP_001329732.1 ankyrin repeat protein [Trichomonas vaginalis G3]